MLATTMEKISLTEVGIEAVKMRGTLTGGVILEVPSDKGRENPSSIVAYILEPVMLRVAAAFRPMELRTNGIDFQ